MAAIHSEKGRTRGTYYRLKIVVDGEPNRIGLGYNLDKKALRSLEVIASKLESVHDVGDSPDPKLLGQINRQLSEELLSKFAEVGLIQGPAPKLGEFLATFIESKKNDVGDHTIAKMQNCARLLVAFLGDVRLSTISAGDAHDYVQHRKKLGKASAS